MISPAQNRLIQNGISRQEFARMFGMTEAANNAFFAWDRTILTPITVEAIFPEPKKEQAPKVEVDTKMLDEIGLKIGTTKRVVAVFLLKNPHLHYTVEKISEHVNCSFTSVKEALYVLQTHGIVKATRNGGERKIWRATI
jgi:predicted aconitase